MPRNDRQATRFEVTLDNLQVGPTDSTSSNADRDLTVAGFEVEPVYRMQTRQLHRSRRGQLVRPHLIPSGLPIQSVSRRWLSLEMSLERTTMLKRVPLLVLAIALAASGSADSPAPTPSAQIARR
ncbi:MAG: hypothetical protein QNJ77_15040 [Acidimicrobiia bacterium]|nr:hypothetical protein [Acidimicrobiia bacterium]